MENRSIYRCFISSPSDCQNERILCQKVLDKINNGLAKHLGINFETFMWENDVLPDVGTPAQEIIDTFALKAQYDVFIGIMKNRFGQQTNKAGSGTEHEFKEALKLKMTNENSLPKIIFFFGKELVDPDNFDNEQYQKVKNFEMKLKTEGLIVKFTTENDFEKKLEDKLNLFVQELSPLQQPSQKINEVGIVLKKLEDDLNESLKIYNEASPIWIEPIISSKKEVPSNPTKNDANRVYIKSLINNPDNLVIKAPSEFGLTTLAHYIKLEAWKVGKSFLYIDAKKTKKHKVVKDIAREVESYFFGNIDTIDCILLDSVCFEENGIMQMIKNICEDYKNIPLIIFNTLDNNFFLKSDEDDKVEIKREFTSYYLLPLPQTEVRKLVTSYSKKKLPEQDRDVILNKVTKDLEVLNMHRTPKNCISILRANLKVGSEQSPINRTKLLEIILNTIFEEYEVPTYRDKKPDVKDCSFVLGYFCEVLVTRNDFEFTEEFFKERLLIYCKDNFIELDLNYLLNVLIANSIIGRKSINILYFKNSYWVFYFISQRMNMNKDFLQSILNNKKYVDFPEIIEFYTGIDRNKEEALSVLRTDLKDTLELVRNKVRIPDKLNPFKSISWQPDISALEREEAKIGENVISSGLPDEVKDKYDDKHYNQIRPYNQVINSVIRDYSFLILMRQISATSRALRNSDFVDSRLKKEVLETIVQSWNEINKILIILSPMLAEKGKVAFEGARFDLAEDDFNIDDSSEKKLAVLLAVPTNVVKFFKDDLFSSKMGPLLLDKAVSESNSLLKHELMLLLISERPKGWNNVVDAYIVSLDKNSFFLSDVFGALSFHKKYKSMEVEESRMLTLLEKKCRAKHIFKNNNPDGGLIKRLDRLNKNSSFN